MSKKTATTTAPPLMVCSSASSVTTPVMMALQGPTSIFGSVGCGSAATTDDTGHKGVLDLNTVPAQLPPSQMTFQAYTHYAMSPLFKALPFVH